MAANDAGRRYWIQTLGCPKNEVDSDKFVGTLVADGYVAADDPDDADLVVVNTCAFIDDARQESIDTMLALARHPCRRARAWSSPDAWPSGTATSSPSRCPRSIWWRGSAHSVASDHAAPSRRAASPSRRHRCRTSTC